MNVLYDYQIFYYQRFGGISKYFSNLLYALHKNNLININLPLTIGDNSEIDFLKSFLSREQGFCPEREWLNIPGKQRFRNLYHKYFYSKNIELMHQELILSLLNKNQIEVFHPTYYEDYYLDYSKNQPLVVTVFDMIYEMYPKYFDKKEHEELCKRKKRVIESADSIIAISESTKKDLCRLYSLPESKVIVIYLANTLQKIKEKHDLSINQHLPMHFLLFVGKRDGYKNFNYFVKSIGSLLKKNKELYLICTGEKFTAQEVELFYSLNIKSKIKNVKIQSDNTMALLYQKATAFVFPSLYEGFGLPILEAMHYGCPVIASNTSSIPEVAGNAALYINPRDSYSISAALSKILEDEILRNELREKGIEQERKFSWDTVAKQTLEVYKSVC